jgi:hypothetical protein
MAWQPVGVHARIGGPPTIAQPPALALGSVDQAWVRSRSSSLATPAMCGWLLVRSIWRTSNDPPEADIKEAGSAPAAINIPATAGAFSGTA